MKDRAKRHPVRSVRVASVRAIFEQRGHGTVYIRSTEALGQHPTRITDHLDFWAREAPHRIFLAQRSAHGAWQEVTYSDACIRVKRLAAGLLREGLCSSCPLVILSGNSIEHALLALAAMYVGIPYAPIAPTYSLAVKEYGALRHVWQDLGPGMVFVQDGSLFAPALQAMPLDGVRVVHHRSAPEPVPSMAFADLESVEPSDTVADANQCTGADSIAKILYTSGSTGLPKGVITTHRMLCSNQQMLRQVMPVFMDEPPVVCDWLPWNHTFGGSHNFGIVLSNGGTLYIDNGKPTPKLFGETIKNLREIAPTVFFNVPKGYEMLVEHLRADRDLREIFFSRLKLLFIAGAGLSQRTWDELQDIAVETCGEEILVVVGMGATETGPFSFSTGIERCSSGWIGLPVPGVELKLVPIGERAEARLRGPSITPGYWRRPDINAMAFDEENYYRTGDAIRLVDPFDSQKGFLFDGRLDEDFKLSSGTWVRTSMLRMRLVAHFNGLLQDAVLAGPDRDYVTALLFPAIQSCRKLYGGLSDIPSAREISGCPEVRAIFVELLSSFAALNSTNSTRVERAILVDSPPSMEAREITDKGTLNQSAVLKHRAAVVKRLYQEPVADDVLCQHAC